MRYFWLPLLLLLTFPAHAAEQTRVFPLRHRTAGEIDQQLVDSWRLAAPGPGLVPDGISAWSVDDRQNALVAVGTDQALEQLSQVLRVIDLPGHSVRLGVRSVRREEVTSRTGTTKLEPNSSIEMAFLTPAQAKALPTRRTVTMAEMTVTPNHPLYAKWPSQPNQRSPFVAVVPRLNSDGTVTLLLSPNARPLEAVPGTARLAMALASGLPSDATIVARRLPIGSALVLLPKGPGEGLLIQVRDGLP
jgi:hypothetical protein